MTKTELKKKKVYFSDHFPSHSRLLRVLEYQRGGNIKVSMLDAAPLVICDRKLQSHPEVISWLENYLVYFVSGGEKIKNLDSLPRHINNILRIIKNKKIIGFISLGGGSVGDFTGFLASVYKRGVPLIHIPSTWLSAMDSAHGGKTALNVGEVKNVIGSYCFPQAVFTVKNLLSTLSEKERESAKGELVKIALIKGGDFYKEIFTEYLDKKNSALDLWNILPQAILAKIKIIEKDPYEKKGLRRLLNFGHTLGHALESYFHIPHGEAVLYGIVFAIQWSHNRFTLSPSFLRQVFILQTKKSQLYSYLKRIPKNKLNQLLLHDKKRGRGEYIDFIFIKGPGKVFTETVSVSDILTEVQKQILLHSK